jgi:hypothetical protein
LGRDRLSEIKIEFRHVIYQLKISTNQVKEFGQIDFGLINRGHNVLYICQLKPKHTTGDVPYVDVSNFVVTSFASHTTRSHCI